MTVQVLRSAAGVRRVSEVERETTDYDRRTALSVAAEATGKDASEGQVTINGNVARVYFQGFTPVIMLLNRV